MSYSKANRKNTRTMNMQDKYVKKKQYSQRFPERENKLSIAPLQN